MKTIGIIGGLGPESTKMYYDQLIDSYRAKADGQSPEIIIYSISMEALKPFQENNDLNAMAGLLSEKVDALARAGADFVIMAANTPHMVFDQVSENSKVPMISIVDETAKYCKHLTENQKIGLLGTGYTMKSNFYPDCFKQYGLTIYVPREKDQDFIHEKIYSELALGIVHEETKKRFFKITDAMVAEFSIDCMVLGCTELPLVFDREFSGLQIVNTVTVHVQSIIDYCFQKG
jgi:aspartate racemase